MVTTEKPFWFTGTQEVWDVMDTAMKDSLMNANAWRKPPEPPKFEGRCQYTVTLNANSITALKSQLKKIGIEDAEIEKVETATSRSERLSEAEHYVDIAKTEVEDLRDELQNWLDNLPENLQGGEKASQLEEAIGNLDEIQSSLDSVDGWDNVEFPSILG